MVYKLKTLDRCASRALTVICTKIEFYAPVTRPHIHTHSRSTLSIFIMFLAFTDRHRICMCVCVRLTGSTDKILIFATTSFETSIRWLCARYGYGFAHFDFSIVFQPTPHSSLSPNLVLLLHLWFSQENVSIRYTRSRPVTVGFLTSPHTHTRGEDVTRIWMHAAYTLSSAGEHAANNFWFVSNLFTVRLGFLKHTHTTHTWSAVRTSVVMWGRLTNFDRKSLRWARRRKITITKCFCICNLE